jgi:protein-disulfide isomerase
MSFRGLILKKFLKGKNNCYNYTMEQHNTSTTHKSFFEKYQLFFAIIICGILIGGGIIVAKVIKPGTAGDAQPTETQASVRNDMIKIAKDLKINKNQFATCLDGGTNKQKVADDVTLAQKSGVQGTPTFFIVQGTKQFEILGARDRVTFDQAIKDGKAPADQPPQPAGNKIVFSDTDHWMGPKDAKTIIVEYGDIDCYYCKQAKPMVDQLLKDHPEYAFVYRQSPIVSLHPWAEYKAEAAECAAQLGNGNETFFKFLDSAVTPNTR